jgi:hypothetical protein
MFAHWPEKSLDRDLQRLSMAMLRLRVVAMDKPVRRVVRWLDAKLDGKTATK